MKQINIEEFVKNEKMNSSLERNVKDENQGVYEEMSLVVDDNVSGSTMWNIYEPSQIFFDGEEHMSMEWIGDIIRYNNNFYVIGISEEEFDRIRDKLPIDLDKEDVYNIHICESKTMFNIFNPESELYKEMCEEW